MIEWDFQRPRTCDNKHEFDPLSDRVALRTGFLQLGLHTLLTQGLSEYQNDMASNTIKDLAAGTAGGIAQVGAIAHMFRE